MATQNSINSTINSTTSGVTVNNSSGVLSSLATTTNQVQIGNASGQLTGVSVGTTGQVLAGNTGSAPTFQTASGISLGTTNHAVQIGNASGTLTSLAVGTNGQLLCGSTSADPAFTTLTSSGSTLTYTTGAHTLNIDVTAPLSVANGGTGATSLTGVLTGNGTSAITANAVTQHGVLIGGASNAVSSLAVASTGATLMGSTGADPAFTGSPSFSGSVTAGTSITSTAGNVVITSGNLNITAASTSSVGQITQAGTRVFHTSGSTTTNLFFGNGSGNFTVSGAFNTVLGSNAGVALTSGADNVCVGYDTGLAITTGQENTIVGMQAGQQFTTGTGNVLLGRYAGFNYTTSEGSNIQIGYFPSGTGGGTVGESNVLKIGNGTGTSAGQINKASISGISGATSASGVAVLVNSSNVLGTTTSSLRFKDNIKDMDNQSEDIYKLRPVTFTYKPNGVHVLEEDAQLRQFGLIAEEVEKIMPDQVTYNKDQVESVRYLNLIPMLLNEVQKLNKRIVILEEIVNANQFNGTI